MLVMRSIEKKHNSDDDKIESDLWYNNQLIDLS